MICLYTFIIINYFKFTKKVVVIFMRLSNIEVKNFKTFKDVSVEFNKSNLLIGSCAAGKSNFVEIFDFLKDLSQDFDKAYRKHGGPYLKNLNLGSDDNPTCLKVSFDDKEFGGISLGLSDLQKELKENESITLQFKDFFYETCVNFKEWDYEILSEKLVYNFDVYKFSEGDFEIISQNTLYINNIHGEFTAELKKEEEYFTITNLIPEAMLDVVKNNFKLRKIPLINSPLSSFPIPLEFTFKDIECYNFNPQFSKGVSEINGDNNLAKYGENLAAILNKIFKDEDNKRKFLNLVNDLLPYIEDIGINQLNDNQMMYSITEVNNMIEIPSFFISDGTSNVISLIVSLYFDDSKYLFIEEPERNIHPSLLSKVVDMIGEASNNKQIFVTTHSPEILKYMDLNDVLFISKDGEGFSKITKPVNNETIAPFIEELGIDKIFIDNYLEWEDA